MSADRIAEVITSTAKGLGRATLRSRLPPPMTVQVLWNDFTTETVKFEYNKSGAERDTHVAATEDYTLTTHPSNDQSTNRREWE